MSHVAESSPYIDSKGLHVNVAMVSAGYLPLPAGSLLKATLPPDRLISGQVAAIIVTLTV